jgi:hypothetical protein
MPLGGRKTMRSQAKINRHDGTWVWLLIPPAQVTTSATAFNISKSPKSVDPNACTLFRVYAKVSYKPGAITYGEGGSTVKKLATVEIPDDWSEQVTASYAIKMTDNSIMLKKTQYLDDSGTTYVIEVESYVNN